MSAPERRRPLPALVAIAALTLLTALVWFRVLHRGVETSGKHTASHSPCPTPTPVAASVLPKPSLVTLIVLNSTNRAGLATSVRSALLKDGFVIPAKATDDGTTYGGHGQIAGVAEIRFGPSQRFAAELVRYYLPGAVMVQTDSSAPSVIVALGAQYKAVRSSAAVAAAITAAHVRVTSPAPVPSPVHSTSC